MSNLVTLIILLFPLVPLGCLFVARSDAWRRTNLLLLAFLLSVELIWYLLLNWIVLGFSYVFSGTGAFLLTRFYGSVWFPVTYVLVIAAIGYIANRYTAEKVSRNEHKKRTEKGEISGKDMEALGGMRGLFGAPFIKEPNSRDEIKS